MPTTDPKNGQLSVDIIPDANQFQQSLLVTLVDRELAQHLVWHFGDRNVGVDPGTFTERLLLTIAAADSKNRDLLAKSFPGQVAGFRAIANEPWGLEYVRSIARES